MSAVDLVGVVLLVLLLLLAALTRRLTTRLSVFGRINAAITVLTIVLVALDPVSQQLLSGDFFGCRWPGSTGTSRHYGDHWQSPFCQ